MITADLSFINGLKLGVEHLSNDEDPDLHWMILIELLIIRISILNWKN